MSNPIYFDVGDRPRSTWTVRLDGDAIDPPAIVFIVQSPSGVEVSIYGEPDQPHPITRSSEGTYYADIPLTEPKTWTRRWVAFDEDGVALDAFERSFTVRQSEFAEPLPAP